MATTLHRGHVHTFQASRIAGGFRPRQFEYSPNAHNLMVIGTVRGEVAIVDHTMAASPSMSTWPPQNFTYTDDVVCADMAATPESTDAVLGLCWLHRTDQNMFVAGSSKGILKLCEVWTSDLTSCSADRSTPAKQHHIRTSTYKEFPGTELG